MIQFPPSVVSSYSQRQYTAQNVKCHFLYTQYVQTNKDPEQNFQIPLPISPLPSPFSQPSYLDDRGNLMARQGREHFSGGFHTLTEIYRDNDTGPGFCTVTNKTASRVTTVHWTAYRPSLTVHYPLGCLQTPPGSPPPTGLLTDPAWQSTTHRAAYRPSRVSTTHWAAYRPSLVSTTHWAAYRPCLTVHHPLDCLQNLPDSPPPTGLPTDLA